MKALILSILLSSLLTADTYDVYDYDTKEFTEIEINDGYITEYDYNTGEYSDKDIQQQENDGDEEWKK